MLDQSTYNYYLKEVLGVSQYIGKPQKAIEQNFVNQAIEQQKVIADSIQNSPLVIVGSELSSAEKLLLNKIMTAAGKPDFKIDFIDNFDKENLKYRYCLILVDDYNIEQNKFEVFNYNKSLVLQSCSLPNFLPPTQDFKIQQNKQLLWKSIQLLFKI